MQLVWDDRTYPITGGIALSMLFHVLLALLIIFGVPSFFEPEVLEAPPTIELAKMADITAAPKVDKQGKPDDKPKPPAPPAPEPPKPTPPKPATPTPPTTASAPPPAAVEKPVAIPDDAAKKVAEKKPEEKKPEKKPDDKPKPKQDKQQSDMDSLLKNLTQNQPAPETKDKPKPKATAAPAQPTVGQQTQLVSDVPLTMAETDGIRAAIEKNWNIPTGMANEETYVVMLRLHLTPDGVVSAIDVLDDSNDPGFRTIAESAKRAILVTQGELGRLPIPKDKYNATMIVRWNMSLICAQQGGC
jgi:outer membrane biosynthesis protein TonB